MLTPTDNGTKTRYVFYVQASISRHTMVHSERHFHQPNKGRGYRAWQLLVNNKMLPDKLSEDGWVLADYRDLYLFIKWTAAFKWQWLKIQSELLSAPQPLQGDVGPVMVRVIVWWQFHCAPTFSKVLSSSVTGNTGPLGTACVLQFLLHKHPAAQLYLQLHQTPEPMVAFQYSCRSECGN